MSSRGVKVFARNQNYRDKFDDIFPRSKRGKDGKDICSTTYDVGATTYKDSGCQCSCDSSCRRGHPQGCGDQCSCANAQVE